MNDLLLHGSLVLCFAWLAIGGLGAPLPEDAALLAAGVLVARGLAHPITAVVVVVVGVLGGDAVLFFTARRLGPKAFERKFFQRILPPDRRARLERAYARHGALLVFGARFIAGIRMGVYATAGLIGMSPRRFLFWDAVAAAVSIPLVMGLGYFGANHLDDVRNAIASARLWMLVLVACAVIAFVIVRRARLRRAAL